MILTKALKKESDMSKIIKERMEQIQKGIVPEGYRKKYMEIIPKEWECKRIGSLANIIRGASPRPIASPKWFDNSSEIGWVRISDVTKSDIYLTETKEYLSE